MCKGIAQPGIIFNYHSLTKQHGPVIGNVKYVGNVADKCKKQ